MKQRHECDRTEDRGAIDVFQPVDQVAGYAALSVHCSGGHGLEPQALDQANHVEAAAEEEGSLLADGGEQRGNRERSEEA